jgi:sugar phosphate isomerase/epimerase
VPPHIDDFSASSAVAELLALVPSPWTGAVWDSHHPHRMGETPDPSPTSSCAACGLIASVNSPALRATFDAANFVQCGVRPFSEAYGLLRPYLVYLQVKDALAATGVVVPAGEGDGQVRETLAALRDSGFDGYVSLEPHLARAGRYGGFSGPEGFTRASRALKLILNELGISWR